MDVLGFISHVTAYFAYGLGTFGIKIRGLRPSFIDFSRCIWLLEKGIFMYHVKNLFWGLELTVTAC
jgi:hypothetical protein